MYVSLCSWITNANLNQILIFLVTSLIFQTWFLPWVPSRFLSRLVFSSVPELHVCSSRATWEYLWKHRPPVGEGKTLHDLNVHEESESHHKSMQYNFVLSLGAYLWLPVKVNRAALPSKNCDFGTWSKSVLLVAVELRAKNLGHARDELELDLLGRLPRLHFEPQLSLLLQVKPGADLSRNWRIFTRLHFTFSCHC